MKGGGLTNTVRVCSLSGTPGAATSDTIFIIVGCAGLAVDGAEVSGGTEVTSDGEGFDSNTIGFAWIGAGLESGGAELTSNIAGLETGGG